MTGKEKCRCLKQIRQRIADENDIPLVTEECSWQGQCKGTCPRCEAELKYLEDQLSARRKLGRIAAVTTLSAGLLLASGCAPVQQTTGVLAPEPTAAAPEITAEAVLMGKIAPELPEDMLLITAVPGSVELEGEIAPEPTLP